MKLRQGRGFVLHRRFLAAQEGHRPVIDLGEFRGRGGVLPFFGYLVKIAPAGETSFAASLRRFAATVRNKGVAIVLSDFFDPDWQEGTPGHSLVFSQGFRLSGIDGCTLTLRNEDTYLIDSSKNIRNSGTHTAAELSVQLDRLSPTKGKATYRHTKNFEKAALVGAWRTEYRYKGFTKHTVVGLELFSTKSKEKVGFWDGTTLTFTFDSKEMSEKFDAAFRQAIRLCTMK